MDLIADSTTGRISGLEDMAEGNGGENEWKLQ